MALLKHYKNHTKTGDSRVQRVGFRGCFRSRSDFFELRLPSLAICDFEVAPIRVTKLMTAGPSPMSAIHGSDKEPPKNALLAREFDRFGTVMAFPKKAGLLLSGMSF